MYKHLRVTLRAILIFGCAYFLLLAVIHLSNIRLASVENEWPKSALVYGKLISQLFGSFALLIALILFVIQKDLEKYRSLLIVSAVWALAHAVFLIYFSFEEDFVREFSSTPSLYVWLPFYSQNLRLEAGLMLLYTLLVFIWDNNILSPKAKYKRKLSQEKIWLNRVKQE